MQEVGGSIPPGSTSLRRLRLLRLGKPYRSEGCHAEARRAKAGVSQIHFPSLRAQRSNPAFVEEAGLLRRCAPRNDGIHSGCAFAKKRL
jgi:hypothetical protein